MPLIQIDLGSSLFENKHEQLSQAIHEAQVEALEIPRDDLFQVFRPRGPEELKFDRTYGGVDRQGLVLIHITMVHRYDVETKRKLYAAIVRRLATLDIRPEDVLISVVENGYEDWYAGSL